MQMFAQQLRGEQHAYLELRTGNLKLMILLINVLAQTASNSNKMDRLVCNTVTS